MVLQVNFILMRMCDHSDMVALLVVGGGVVRGESTTNSNSQSQHPVAFFLTDRDSSARCVVINNSLRIADSVSIEKEPPFTFPFEKTFPMVRRHLHSLFFVLLFQLLGRCPRYWVWKS